MGDVPATLLSPGISEEFGEHCCRLIKEMGAGGGFMLSSRCSVPMNAKAENVSVMIDSVRKTRQ